ncbi:TPA: hypothetical protein HA278_06990 [Candidatus Woesearchaeota archaeon]|nr:hypothetical protein [Candidatus Woesearchaeota archaeon]
MLNINAERAFGLEIECFIPEFKEYWYCTVHNQNRGENYPQVRCITEHTSKTEQEGSDQFSCCTPTTDLCTYKMRRRYITDSGRNGGSSAHACLENYLERQTDYPFVAEGYNHRTTNHWKIIYDGSLNSHQRKISETEDEAWFWATEIVSPKLYGPSGLRQAYETIFSAQEYGAYINKECGLHVHHDAEYLSLAGLNKLIEFYILYEPILDSILPKSRRGTNNRWAQSMQKAHFGRYKNVRNILLKQKESFKTLTDERIIKAPNHASPSRVSGGRNAYPSSEIYGTDPREKIPPERDFSIRHKNRFVNKTVKGDKYKKLNLVTNYNTIEFRHHSGSTDRNKIINWIALTSKIMDFCSHAKTTINSETEPSLETMSDLLRLDNSIYTYYQNRQEHFINSYGKAYANCAPLPPRPKRAKKKKQPKQGAFKLKYK